MRVMYVYHICILHSVCFMSATIGELQRALDLLLVTIH